MKKIIYTIAIGLFMACSTNSDCNIDSSLITDYSNQISAIKDKQAAATLQSIKEAFQTQIDGLNTKISEESNKCD